mmetsp:Transcript_35731/g.77989  ORF Transcript_35731/g.77989 Transcript_35731/m.77989 type:complete len:317 (-) Transcript_35731:295-1245(-)|eukprot:CAMPEP_0118936618 /NCGR_PEP_ID=MMETSP1169-20130426/19687_1 /TAXON_ID=36882 /ORGANISM="Pyramimonas obovata, Strain CCMP722" /LENGTH=316 /DNA_ID=CAMNT_0006879933 /DNA_START=324 /DNA_END=1274 /DNA_ORIENTATION=+
MADDPSAPPQGTSGTSGPEKTPPNEPSRPAFKVKAMKVPPSQQRLEARIQEAVARRNKAAQRGSCAFGSGCDRTNGIGHHLKRESAPDPGVYFDPEDTFVSEAKCHSPRSGQVRKSLSTLWARSKAERLYESKQQKTQKHLGVGTYSPHVALDKTHSSGSMWLDKGHCSSSFATRTKRFDKVPLEVPETTITQDMVSKQWLARNIINYKCPRFKAKDVVQHDKGFLTQPPDTPGFIYNTDCYMLPTIMTSIKSEPPSRTFIDRRERFPTPKFQYKRPLGPDSYAFSWHQAMQANKVTRIPPKPKTAPSTADDIFDY